MIRGSIVALVTPMLEDGEIDYASVARLLDFHVEAGTAAIVAAGTTGESATLDFAEHDVFVRKVIELAAGRIPIIAGAGGNSTSEAIFLTQAAKDAGAIAALQVTPYYNKPTQEGLYQHFKAIAEAVEIDNILYNVPGRTACDMLPETVGRLSSIPNIIGLKDATGDLRRVAVHRHLCGNEFLLYSGDDETGCDFNLLGGDGVISVTANVAPALMQEMVVKAVAGQRDEARAINRRLQPLHCNLFVQSNPIPVKWAVEKMGLCGPHIRLPLTYLAPEYCNQLKQALVAADIALP